MFDLKNEKKYQEINYEKRKKEKEVKSMNLFRGKKNNNKKIIGKNVK